MQKKNAFWFCLFFMLFVIVLCSCDCHRKGNGIVIDRQTNQPLENVEVKIYLASIHKDSLQNPVFTDKNGKYKFVHNYCKDYMINFHKEGYNSFVTSIKENDTIYLEVYKK